jgi:hypothetical protein
VLKMDLNDYYEEILNPNELINNFENLLEFEKWCLLGSILDLEECLKVFVHHELYEHCAVIRNVLEDKKDETNR